MRVEVVQTVYLWLEIAERFMREGKSCGGMIDCLTTEQHNQGSTGRRRKGQQRTYDVREFGGIGERVIPN